jgi:hypothetical protein
MRTHNEGKTTMPIDRSKVVRWKKAKGRGAPVPSVCERFLISGVFGDRDPEKTPPKEYEMLIDGMPSEIYATQSEAKARAESLARKWARNGSRKKKKGGGITAAQVKKIVAEAVKSAQPTTGAVASVPAPKPAPKTKGEPRGVAVVPLLRALRNARRGARAAVAGAEDALTSASDALARIEEAISMAERGED